MNIDEDGYLIIPKPKEEIEFSEEEISDMKNLLEDKIDIDDELEDLKKEAKSIYVESIILGKVFLKCYNLLHMNLHLFKGGDKNFIYKLKKYLESFNIGCLRDEIESYGDGTGFGSYYGYQNILEIVAKDRQRMIDLVLLFFKIVGEEE